MLLDENNLYVGKEGFEGILEKYTISPWNIKLSFVGHTSTISSILLYNEKIISADINGNIFAWSKETGEVIMQYFGFQNTVFAITIFEETLLAGGKGGSIIRWKIDNGEVIKTFAHTHAGNLLSMQVLNDKVFTGSSIGGVIRWNLSDYSPFILQRRLNSLRTIAVWKNFLISGSDDSRIRVYDSTSGDTLPVFTAVKHRSFVAFVHVYEDFLFSGGSDSLIIQWNLLNMTMLKIFYGKNIRITINREGHVQPVSGLDSDSTFLYSGGYDMVVRKWNISSGSQIAVSSRHNAFITTICVTNEFVLSGSEDGIIKVWNKDSISEMRFFDSTFKAET
jgi:WD40 repeat protein